MHKVRDVAYSVERGEGHGREYQRQTREGENDADISHSKDSAYLHRGVFMRMCILQSEGGEYERGKHDGRGG